MKNKGFTLIELLVVIAIIGILSSVVLASLNSARVKGRDAKRVSDLSQLKLALELYFDSNREYPQVGGVATTVLDSVLTPNYIQTIPSDPLANGAYYYHASGTTNYILKATLEDGSHAVLAGDVDGSQTATNGPVACGTQGSETEYCIMP